MKSDLIVMSWWSNCLGLACLHRLVGHTRERENYVAQAGKPEDQVERFRTYLPPPMLFDWVARCVGQFAAFYATCPSEWVSIEDPALTRRIEEFRQAVSG